MVLSSRVLEDDRKRTGRDEKAAQVCWPVEETAPQRDYILRHLDRSPCRTSTAGPGLTDDHCVRCQGDNPSDLSWQLREPGRLCAVLCVCVMFPCPPASLRLSLVRPFQVKEH